MTARQESKQNMYRTVEETCDDNNAIIITNPAFVAALTILKAIISSIISTTTLQAQIISGVAIDKAVLKKNLCQNAADIAAVVYAYASSISNNTLKQAVNYSFSDLFKLKDDLLAPTAQNIYKAANDNIAALANFGITPALLTVLKTSIDDYSTAVPKPRSAKAIKETHSKNLKQLQKQADDILKEQMDKLIVTFKPTAPNFVTTYLNARVIIDPAKINTQIKGTITNTTSTEPVVEATIQLQEKPLTATTDINGHYILKPLKPGIYSIAVSKEGYQSKTINNIQVKLGKAITVDVPLQPNP